MRTVYKDAQTEPFGLIRPPGSRLHHKLPAGDYVSHCVSTHPGFPDVTANVYLHILPGG